MRTKNLRLASIIGFAVLSSAGFSAANAATVFSENFNSPAFQGSTPILLNDTSDRWASTNYYTINNTNGWTFTGGSYLAVDGASRVFDGALLVNENGTNANNGAGGLGVNTTISNLVVGQKYDLSLLLSGDNRPGLSYTLNTSIGSSSFSTVGTDLPAGSNPGTLVHYLFTASSASEVLALSQASGTEASPIVDNISISAVPEPATWAMFLLGFGAIGWTMRGRRRQLGAAAA